MTEGAEQPATLIGGKDCQAVMAAIGNVQESPVGVQMNVGDVVDAFEACRQGGQLLEGGQSSGATIPGTGGHG